MKSVNEVLQENGFPYDGKVSQIIGRTVSRLWRREHGGEAPTYAMRQKSNPENTGHAPAHLKAVYPDEWSGRIVEVAEGVYERHGIVRQTATHPPTNTPKEQQVIYPIGKAWEYIQEVREDITTHRQCLVWRVSLHEEVGVPDMEGDPNGYTDGRWTGLIERMWAHVREHHPWPQGQEWDPETPLALGMLVRCHWDGKYQWVRVSVDVPHCVDVAAMAQRPPPVGRWEIVSYQELRGTLPYIPAGFFRDGIPF